MANLSESERSRLARLVATSIDRLGITEVSRITELSTTALREYVTSGIPPGARAASLDRIRRLEGQVREMKAARQAPPREPTTPELLAELRRITEALAERLHAEEDPGDGPGAQRLRDVPTDTRNTGNPGTRRRRA